MSAQERIFSNPSGLRFGGGETLAQFFVFLFVQQYSFFMPTIRYALHFGSVVTALIFFGCASGPLGRKVKEPFRGSAYESNNRFFRGTGKGVSSQDNIARGKADIDAKAQLAGQVNTTMKQVADQYLGQTENANAADVADKFQSLVRQVMNTEMADLRKIGEQKYFNETSKEYTVFMAYEIKKNAMLRFMKKQAKTDQTIDERQRNLIEKIIDEELDKVKEEGGD
jgi:hypothetical protein